MMAIMKKPMHIASSRMSFMSSGIGIIAKKRLFSETYAQITKFSELTWIDTLVDDFRLLDALVLDEFLVGEC